MAPCTGQVLGLIMCGMKEALLLASVMPIQLAQTAPCVSSARYARPKPPDKIRCAGLCPVGDNPFTQNQQQVAFVLTLADGGAAAISSQLRFRLAVLESSAVSATHATYKGTAPQKTAFATSISSALTKSGIASAASVHFLSSTALEHKYAVLLTVSPRGLFNNLIPPPMALTLADFTCFAETGLTCSLSVHDNTQMTVGGTNTAAKTYRIKVLEQETSAPAKVAVSVDGGPFLTNPADMLSMHTSSALDISAAAGGVAGDVTALFPVSTGHTVGAVWTIFPTGSGGSSSSYVAKPGIRETLVCGGVGTCSFSTGTCTCPSGTTGASCSELDLAAQRFKSQPVVDALASDLLFDGSIVSIRSTRVHSSDFDFITVAAADQPAILQLRGDGRLTTQELHAKAGVTVGTGGLVVDNSGISIRSGGIALAAHSSSNDVTLHDGMVVASSTSTTQDLYSFSSAVLSTPGKSVVRISAPYLASVLAFTTAKPDGTSLFSIDGTGTATATEGSINVNTGNIGVLDGTVSVNSASSAETPLTVHGVHRSALIETSGTGSSPTAESTLRIHAKNMAFSGTIASFESTRPADPAFNFVKISSDSGSVDHIQVTGTGQLRANSGAEIRQGITIVNGGLQVPSSESVLYDLRQTNEAGGVSLVGHFHQKDLVGQTASTLLVDVFGTVSMTSRDQVSVLGSESTLTGGANVLLSAGKTSTAKAAGAVSICGGETASTTRGGYVSIQTMDTPAATAVAAGHISILSGTVPATGGVTAEAGSIFLQAGGNLKAGGSHPAGQVHISGGQSQSGHSGLVSIKGGNGLAAGSSGGTISVLGGEAVTFGGDIIMHAGQAAAHGKVEIQARDSVSNLYVPAFVVSSDGSVGVTSAPGKELRLQPGTSAAQAVADQHILAGKLGGSLFLSSPAGEITSASLQQNSVVSHAGPVLLSAGSASSSTAKIEGTAHGDIQLTAGYVSNTGSIVASAATNSRYVSKAGFFTAQSEAGHTSILVGSATSSAKHTLFMGAHPADTHAVEVEIHGGPGTPAGGAVQIMGGAAGSTTATGGAVSLLGAAAGGGTGKGGAVYMYAGSGIAGGGDGGDVAISSGAGVASSKAGGNIVLSAGDSLNGKAGSVNIFSGASHGGGAAGDAGAIIVSAGGGTATPANNAGGSISVLLGKGVASDGEFQLKTAAQAGTANFALRVQTGTTSVRGGNVLVQSGADGSGGSLSLSSALGKSINIAASGASGANVGSITLSSGSGGQAGSISVVSGESSGASPSGSIVLSARGVSSAAGTPGNVIIGIGSSTVASKGAGYVLLSAGKATGGGVGVAGGGVSIIGGEASSNTALATGGAVTIQGGSNTGTAVSRSAGDVQIKGGQDMASTSHGKVEILTATGTPSVIVSTDLTTVQGSSTVVHAMGGQLSLFTAATSGQPLKVLAGKGESGAGGANLELRGGKNAAGHGGSVSISGGDGSGSAGATGGGINIIAGASFDAAGQSGFVLISTPDPPATGSTGTVSIVTGKATTVKSGSILLQTGLGASTAAAGDISIVASGSNSAAGGSILLSVGKSTSAADGTFALVDAGAQSVVLMSSTSLQVQQDTIHIQSTQQELKIESHNGKTLGLHAGTTAATSGGDFVASGGDRSIAGTAGSVSILSGVTTFATGAQTGGHLLLSSGAATGSALSSAGPLSIIGGSGMAQGAHINIASGSAAANGKTGDVVVSVAAATGTALAGQLSLIGGSSAGGQAGSIHLSPGTGSSAANGKVVVRSGTNREAIIVFDDQVSMKSGGLDLESDTENLSLIAQEGKVLQLFGEASASGQGAHVHLRAGDGMTAGTVSIVSGSGASAAGAIALSAGSVSSGSSAGGSILMSAGDSTNTFASQGGHVVLQGGKTNYNNGAAATGGHLSLIGGVSTDKGKGGSIKLVAGICSHSSIGCSGGDILLSAGHGSAGSNHGKLQLLSAEATTVLSSDAVAKQLTLFESTTHIHASTELKLFTDDSSSVTAGAVILSAGQGLVAQEGGAVSILAGNAVKNGGSVSIAAGESSAEDGGAVYLNGGDTTAAKAGGSIVLRAGSSSAAGSAGGHVSILAGSGTSSDGNVVVKASGTGTAKVVSSGGHDTLIANPNETILTGKQVTVLATAGNVNIHNQLGHDIDVGFLGSSAGSISLTGGMSGTFAGSVHIKGGTSGAGMAGNVELRPGGSTTGTKGSVVIHSQDSGGVPALTINSQGSIFASEVSTTLASAAGKQTMVRSGPGTVGSGAGGHLLLSAESTSGAGGSTSIFGGQGPTAGNVVMQPGSGTTSGKILLREADASIAIAISTGATVLNADHLTLQSTGAGAGRVSILSGAQSGNMIDILAGGGSTAGTNGGALRVQGGASTDNVVAAGSVEIDGGFSNRNVAGELGGTVSIKGGKSRLVGGPVVVQGGQSVTSSGGPVSIISGASSAGDAGSVEIIGAVGTANGHGGHIAIQAGAGGGTGSGGSITFQPGAGTPDGQVHLQSADGQSSIELKNTGYKASFRSAHIQTTAGDLELQSSESNSIRIQAGAELGTVASNVEVYAGRSTSGVGGVISIIAGSSTQASGGSLLLSSGAGGTVDSSGSGGELSMTAGQGQGGSHKGGDMRLESGPGVSGAQSGLLVLASGSAATTASSGTVSITSGSTANANSGDVHITTGVSTTLSSGDVYVKTSASTGAAASGNVNLQPGQGASTVLDGKVLIRDARGAQVLVAETQHTVLSSSNTVLVSGAGDVTVKSGTSGSGNVQVEAAASSSILLSTGAAGAGSGGHLVFVSGSGASSGGVMLSTGSSTMAAGTLSIFGGESSGNAGNVLLSGGKATFAGSTAVTAPYDAGTISIIGGSAADNANAGANHDSAAGHVVLSGGNAAGDLAGANGGDISVLAGTGSTDGKIVLRAPNAGVDALAIFPGSTHVSGKLIEIKTTVGHLQLSSVDSQSIQLLAGGGTSATAGGDLLLRSGKSTSASGSGSINVVSGDTTSVSQQAGAVMLSGGVAQGGNGIGGTVSIVSGEGSGPGAAAGTIHLVGGKAQTGSAGTVQLSAGSSATSGAAGSVNIFNGISPSGADGHILLSLASGSANDGKISLASTVEECVAISDAQTRVSGPSVQLVSTGASGQMYVASAASRPLILQAGHSGNTGGVLSLLGGNHGSASGHAAVLQGGTFSGSGAFQGGPVSIVGGEATSGTIGGEVVAQGGASAAGGPVQIRGGAGSNVGGGIELHGGVGVAMGGQVSLAGGNGPVAGSISLFPGTGATSNGMVAIYRVASHSGSQLAFEASDSRTAVEGQEVVVLSRNSGTTQILAEASSQILLSVQPSFVATGSQSISIIGGARAVASEMAGPVVVRGGQGSGFSTASGGQVSVHGGDALQGPGGHAVLQGGTGAATSNTGNGGSVSVVGGEAFARSGSATAGSVVIQGGKANSAVTSGSVSIVTVAGGTGGAAGNVHIALGAGTSDGEFEIFGANAASRMKVSSTTSTLSNGMMAFETTQASTGTMAFQTSTASSFEVRTGGSTAIGAGNLLLSTGKGAASATSTSGAISIASGDSLGAPGKTGGITIASGASGKTSGSISMTTGAATESTGALSFETGSVGSNTGSRLELLGSFPGNAAHGHVTLSAGSSSSTGGHVSIVSGTGTSLSGSVKASIGGEPTARFEMQPTFTRMGASDLGGSVALIARDSSGSSLSLTSGDPTIGDNGNGVTVQAGRSTTATPGGSIGLYAGSSTTAQSGGSVMIRPGSSTSGSPGTVLVQNAAGSTIQTFGTSEWSVASTGQVKLTSADSQNIELVAGGTTASTPAAGASVQIRAEAGATAGGNVEITAGGGPASLGGNVIVQAGSNGAVQINSGAGTTVLQANSAGAVELLADTIFKQATTATVEGKLHIMGNELKFASSTTNSLASYLDVVVPWTGTTIDVRSKIVVRLHRDGVGGSDQIINVNCNHGQLIIVINDDLDDALVTRPGTCGAGASSIDRHRVLRNSVGLFFCSCP